MKKFCPGLKELSNKKISAIWYHKVLTFLFLIWPLFKARAENFRSFLANWRQFCKTKSYQELSFLNKLIFFALRKSRQYRINEFDLNCTFYNSQLISKANCQAEDSSIKRTNEFVFTSMRRVFVRFLEESSARKKNVSRLPDL